MKVLKRIILVILLLAVGIFAFLYWGSYENGEMAVDSRVFDVGIQTSHALQALKTGVAPEYSGPSEERAHR